MQEIKTIIAAVFMVLILLATFASFIGVKLDNPPPQHISPVTGYPTWHETYPQYEDELGMAFTSLSLIFTLFSSYIAWRANRPPSRSLTGWVSKNGREETSFQINLMVLYYVLATFAAIVGYIFLDVGKIWAVVGALHNLLEVMLLVLFAYGGRVESLSYGLVMFVYVVLTIVLSEYGPWPIDAVFFRWQGLCSDFGLLIFFTRLYVTTLNQLKAFGDLNKHDKLLRQQQRAVDQNVAAIVAENATAPTAMSANQPAEDHRQLEALERIKKHLVAKAPAPEQARQQQQEQEEEAHRSEARTSRRARFTHLFYDNSSSSSDDSSDDERASRNPFHRSGLQKSKGVAATLHNGSAEPPVQHTNGHAASSTTHLLSPSEANTSIAIPPPLSVNDVVHQSSVEWGVKWRNPDQLLLLIAAAFFHVAGNVVTTIWTQSLPALAVFQISYGLAFPLYGYYLYVDNHALRQTKVYLPSTSKASYVLYVSLSIFLSTLTVRLGLYVASKAAELAP
ncbi:hypothetical protein DFQ26_005134 [Actinomortierella ambigua]|nr:hypothetical protein DFQ26_005134 [Actinomortierella ambigua]